MDATTLLSYFSEMVVYYLKKICNQKSQTFDSNMSNECLNLPLCHSISESIPSNCFYQIEGTFEIVSMNSIHDYKFLNF